MSHRAVEGRTESPGRVLAFELRQAHEPTQPNPLEKDFPMYPTTHTIKNKERRKT